MEQTFEMMVDSAYDELSKLSKPKIKLILPNIEATIETTRLHWHNICDIMTIIRRDPEHFIIWFQNELTAKKPVNWYSGNKDDGLIVHGRFRKNDEIKSLLLKYVNAFVVCVACNSSDSDINRIASGELQFKCNDCGTTRYIV